ncbi:hypothetical protein L218DRAFT_1007528 [Marasmius fiardii PR-910]|nr:hypothetical protein L218DRAFT_1007528 [Marasmius fiardii PR-910]
MQGTQANNSWERSPSPSCLQKIDEVKPNTPQDSKNRSNQYNKESNQYNSRRNTDRFNKLSDKRPKQSSVPGQLYRMVDAKGSGNTCLFQMVEVSDAEEEGSGAGSDNALSDNEMLAAMNSGSEPEQLDNESDPWRGPNIQATPVNILESVSSESKYEESSND